MKKIILFILFINLLFLINLAAAARIGVSPAIIEFNIDSGIKICEKATLFSNSNETLIGETRWSSDKEFEKNLNKYTLNPEDLKIKIEFPENVKVDNKKQIEICLTGKRAGKYYGALIYKTENKPAGIGIWISANINGDEETPEISAIKLTGNIVSNKEDDNKTKTNLSLSTLFLFAVFIILIIVKGKVQNKKI